jgi:hypothetical protein
MPRSRIVSCSKGRVAYDVEPNLAPLAQSRVPEEWELTYDVNSDRIRRTIEQFGDKYIGRTLLLGVTHTGPDGDFRDQEQLVGTIMVVDLDDGIVVSCDPDGRQFILPGDPSWVERAPAGEYRLRSTGQVVTNPDYLACLTLRQPR